MLEASDYVAGIELLHELGCTDGLPVVLPERDLVDAMVIASGLDGDLSLGRVPPLLGAATVEKVAVAAVMAGCLPDHFPVVMAAVQAICDPVLDIGEVQATTHNLAPLVIVNGPARDACGGIASGTGALGPGHRANAAIGRAVRLVLINLGGGRAGHSDMALLGHPGKFTYCFAEDEEASPFPPLHTSLGYTAEQSVVTVVCVEAPHSVALSADSDDPTSAERLLHQLAAVLSNAGSNNHIAGAGAQVVVLNPEHAQVLAAAGLDRAGIQAALAERAVRRRSESWVTTARADAEGSELLHAVADPSDLLVVVGGGGGMYSAVMPSWGVGPHLNTYVTHEVVVVQACDVPWLVD